MSETTTPTAAFTETEAAEFQKADRAAARNIVVLITSIFILGVCLYSYVAIVCAG